MKKGRLPDEERRASIGRVSTTTALEACADAPVVIEAVVEDMAVKSKVFGDPGWRGRERMPCSPRAPPRSPWPASRRPRSIPERVVGLHFFNPVPAMRLVEVVAGPSTDPSAISQVEGVAERLGKTPIQGSTTRRDSS